MVNGREMPMFEVAVLSVFNQTIKSGKPRDLKLLYDLLEKYGGIPEVDQRAQAEAGAQQAINRIMTYFYRTHDVDPSDVAAQERASAAEADLVMNCLQCGPELGKRWRDPDYKARVKRYAATPLHQQVLKAREPTRR
jgi:hypothetical protein